MIKNFLVMLLIIFVACEKQNSSDHGHSHGTVSDQTSNDNTEETFKTTLFSDSTEFFVEYSPLILNEKSDFLIHLTRLGNFKPALNGQVSIIIGDQGVKTTKIFSPGIFKLRFQPKTSGKFAIKLKFELNNQIEEVIDSVIIFKNQEETRNIAQEEVPGAISFLKEQVWTNNFMVKRVSVAPFESVVKASGEMLPMPGEKQNVAAKSTGILLFASKNSSSNDC